MGPLDGSDDGIDDLDGKSVGWDEGLFEGTMDMDGFDVGLSVGVPDGIPVGISVGGDDGCALGDCDIDGLCVTVGPSVGVLEGLFVVVG